MQNVSMSKNLSSSSMQKNKNGQLKSTWKHGAHLIVTLRKTQNPPQMIG